MSRFFENKHLDKYFNNNPAGKIEYLRQLRLFSVTKPNGNIGRVHTELLSPVNQLIYNNIISREKEAARKKRRASKM